MANPEHLAILRQGVEEWKSRWRYNLLRRQTALGHSQGPCLPGKCDLYGKT
jgi:hypothetical protein